MPPRQRQRLSSPAGTSRSPDDPPTERTRHDRASNRGGAPRARPLPDRHPRLLHRPLTRRGRLRDMEDPAWIAEEAVPAQRRLAIDNATRTLTGEHFSTTPRDLRREIALHIMIRSVQR